MIVYSAKDFSLRRRHSVLSALGPWDSGRVDRSEKGPGVSLCCRPDTGSGGWEG